jgi:hypothetical protein
MVYFLVVLNILKVKNGIEYATSLVLILGMTVSNLNGDGNGLAKKLLEIQSIKDYSDLKKLLNGLIGLI